MNLLLPIYFTLNTIYIIYSWGFVDANMPFIVPGFLHNFAYDHRYLSLGFHVGFVVALFALYGLVLHQVQKKRIALRGIQLLIGACFLLLVSFPSLSNDVFNYMATARVTYQYRENPYIVMPIEIPNEPMLAFLHAANKIALYGPVWIAFTFVPHVISSGNLLASIFVFKVFSATFYLLLLYGLWKISQKNIWPVVFVGLNPLVVMETFIAGHNDVVMMALAVWSFYFLMRWKNHHSLFLILYSLFLILASIGIKYATIVLVPVWIYMLLKKKWDVETLGRWGFWAMMIIFFLSPLREEMYPWYYIWPLTFASLLPPKSLPAYISYGFSFGLMFRYAPFLLTREWGGVTPIVKKLVTSIPPALTSIVYVLKKKR